MTERPENLDRAFDDHVAELRSRVGESARFWCADDGHEVSAGWWKALSGAPDPSFNVVLCHGPDPELVARSIETVAAAGAPSTIGLAGPAVANAQALVDGGWVCIGSTPLMERAEIDGSDVSGDGVVLLGPDDEEIVRELVGQAFSLHPGALRTAVPASVFARADYGVWALKIEGEVRSCLVTALVDTTVVCWSMATSPKWRGRGYGSRLLGSVLARFGSRGARNSALYSSPAGEPFYRGAGYRTLEHWQLWSRPRWVMGRS